MILINYWTDKYYRRNAWDKIYCKNLESSRKALKKELESKILDDLNEGQIKFFLDKYDKWIVEQKTTQWRYCFQEWLESIGLFIMAEKIELI